jgi:hypothetical protein
MENKSPIDFSNISVTETMNDNLESFEMPINKKPNIDINDFFISEIYDKNNDMGGSATSSDTDSKSMNIIEDVEDLTELNDISVNSATPTIRNFINAIDKEINKSPIKVEIKQPEIQETRKLLAQDINKKILADTQSEIKPKLSKKINQNNIRNSENISSINNQKNINAKNNIIQESEIKKPIIQESEIKKPIIQESEIKKPIIQESEIKKPMFQESEIKKPMFQESEIKKSAIKEQEIKKPIVQQKKKIIHKVQNEIKNDSIGQKNNNIIEEQNKKQQMYDINENKDKQNDKNKLKFDYTYYAIYGFNISTTSVYLAIVFIIFTIIYFIYLYRSPNIVPVNNFRPPNIIDKKPINKKKVSVSYEEQKKINKTVKQK